MHTIEQSYRFIAQQWVFNTYKITQDVFHADIFIWGVSNFAKFKIENVKVVGTLKLLVF